MDVVDVTEAGTVVREGGVLARLLRVSSLNPWVMDEQEADRVIDALGRTLTRFPAGARLMFCVDAQPVRLDDLRERSRERSRRAITATADGADEAYRAARLQLALEETLAMHASEDGAMSYSYYAVVAYHPPAPLLELRRRPRTLQAHRRAEHELQARVDTLRGELQARGITSHPLDGAAALEVLWACCNPTRVARDGVPRGQAARLVERHAAREIGEAEAAQRARALRDFLGTSAVAEHDDLLRIGEDLHLTLAVARKPEAVTLGWMLPAMQVGQPFRFVVHVTARDARRERRRLRREYKLNWGAQRASALHGQATDWENAGLHGELAQINARLTAGERLGFFDVAAYMSVRNPGPVADAEELRQVARRAGEELCTATNAEVTLGVAHQLPLWQATLPLAHDPAAITGLYTSDVVGAMVPLLGAECGAPDGIPLFFTAGRGLARLDPMDPEALNWIITIVGAQGSGKTMWANGLTQGMLRWGMRGYIIDRADHYLPLLQLVGGAHLPLGAGANRHRICPWDTDDPARVPDEKITFLLDLHAAVIGRRTGGGYGLESLEEGLLDTAIREVYRAAAQHPELRPCESELRAALERRAADDRTAGAAERAAVADDLAARLEQFVGDGSRSWLLDDATTLPADGVPLVLFDTRDVPEALQGPVALILTDHVARAAERRLSGLSSPEAVERKRELAAAGLPPRWADWYYATFLGYDETWSIVGQEHTGRAFNDIARRSRHLGLVMWCATQRLEDFDTPWGRALLSSATNQVFLAQKPRDFAVLERLAGLSAHELDLIRTHVHTNVGREARAYWINGSRGRGVVSYRVGPTGYWMATSHPTDRPRRERAVRAAGGEDLWAAIDALLTEQARDRLAS